MERAVDRSGDDLAAEPSDVEKNRSRKRRSKMSAGFVGLVSSDEDVEGDTSSSHFHKKSKNGKSIMPSRPLPAVPTGLLQTLPFGTSEILKLILYYEGNTSIHNFELFSSYVTNK